MGKKLKLVKISWYDHCNLRSNGWKDYDEVTSLKPVYIETVGWILKETKKYYIVAATLSDGSGCTGDFLILKGTVKKIKELK